MDLVDLNAGNQIPLIDYGNHDHKFPNSPRAVLKRCPVDGKNVTELITFVFDKVHSEKVQTEICVSIIEALHILGRDNDEISNEIDPNDTSWSASASYQIMRSSHCAVD